MKPISIIIINYNTYELTKNAVRSVYEHCDEDLFELIVVDNCSPIQDIDALSVDFPGVIIVKSTINGGFAKGNNLGIRHAQGKYILLLNSDTLFTADSITPCKNFLETHPSAGAVSVPLIYPDGRYQKNARAFRSLQREVLDMLRPLLYLVPYRQRAAYMLNQYFKGDSIMKVDWLSGAFVMFPKAVIDKMPEHQLDDRYFMYGEDQLWGYQVQQIGYENWFIPGTPVIHIEQASTKKDGNKVKKLGKMMIGREWELIEIRLGKGWYATALKLLHQWKKETGFLIKSIFNIN